MLTEYIEAAMRQPQIERNAEDGDEYPDQRYIGTIPACQGVIGIGEAEDACRRDTQDALEDWIFIRISQPSQPSLFLSLPRSTPLFLPASLTSPPDQPQKKSATETQ